MTPTIALCTDVESVRRPDLIGLAGENLLSQGWLSLFTSADEARNCLQRDRSVKEVWVASCTDVAPINLAAALKRDRPELCVCLLTFEGTGSLMSRVTAAGIDASLTRQAFVARYAQRKRASLDAGAEGVSMPNAQPRVNQQNRDQLINDNSTRSLSAGAVSADVSSHLARVAASAKRGAFVLTVMSGSGGAGKSTVAALSALLAQGGGYKTLLIDLDLQFGDMRSLVGMSDALGVDELIASPGRMQELNPQDPLPAFLAAPRHLESAEALVRKLPTLLTELQGRFEVIVVNTGASWQEQHALLLERSSKALFLVDQRLSSLRACQHAVDLCVRCGMATSPFLFVANRCSKGTLLTSIDVSCAMRGAHAVELQEGGREVEELMSAGQPLDLIASGNELCTSLERVLGDLLPEGDVRIKQVSQPQGSRIERMFGRGRRQGKRGAACRG